MPVTGIFPLTKASTDSKDPPWSSLFKGMVASLTPGRQSSSSEPATIHTNPRPPSPTIPTPQVQDSQDVLRTPDRSICNVHNDAQPPTKRRKVSDPEPNLLSTQSLQSDNVTHTSIDHDARLAATSGPEQSRRSRKDEKRALRSHDEGLRPKSELAVYFPYYEDIMNDVQSSNDVLPPETILRIDRSHMLPEHEDNQGKPTSSNIDQYNGAQELNFSTLEEDVGRMTHDPLSDELYFASHRRAERREKQLRNIEKERAMHEKVQLERLLSGLMGHDWLKVMGVTGVTDTEARSYEGRRGYFISEVKILVDKFRQWKEQEKRLKAQNGALVSEDVEAGELHDSDTQHLSEHVAMPKQSSTRIRLVSKRSQQPTLAILQPAPPERPFTSFYDKPHLRAAALGGTRHGRTSTAFGQLLPDLPEQDFALPAEYMTPEALRESGRRQRIRNRQSVIDEKLR